MSYYLKHKKLPQGLDYKEIGLMSGVEIHQQLHTDKKMFCRCPSRIYREDYHTKVLRHMRPTMSEMGEYDGTALMEFKKKKEIIYLVNKESTCTYELDDTPPFMVNEQGLDIAIEIALMLNCSIVDELHITRKQYLDGSIPTGFQRTALVGLEGWVNVDGKKVGIIQLGFEEDSCREVSDVRHTITFRPDRLGMPLIEAVTHPVLYHPVEVARTVEVLGRIFRATGHVRRGYGSVREDVNVSIRGGTRVEIKGVPRIPFIPLLVHNEALRQKMLLELRDELHRRGFTAENSILSDDKDVTQLLSRTNQPVLANALSRGDRLRALCMRGVSGLAEWPVNPNRAFQDEIKGRLRVVACLDEKPYTMSTIDFGKHGLTQDEIDTLHRELNASDRDVVFLIWGNDRDAKLGCSEIVLRWSEATQGIPPETRQRLATGETDYERTLPGPERMYPDTDLPPRPIVASRIQAIRDALVEQPESRENRLRSYGLSPDIVYHLAISPRYGLFRNVVEKLGTEPLLAGELLDRKMRALFREGKRVSSLPDETIFAFFRMFSEGGLVREAIEKAIAAAADNPASTPEEIVRVAGLEPIGRDDALKSIASAKDEADTITFNGAPQRERFIMGRSMSILRGRFPGKEVYKLCINGL